MPSTDHHSLWGDRASGRLAPSCFISQPYEIPVAALTAWLIEHGCRADVFPPSCSWYHHTTFLVEVRRVCGTTGGHLGDNGGTTVIRFHGGIKATRKIYGRDYRDISRGERNDSK
jgi:hypothetical protein